ncbi:MAG: PorP/SprF family type IX secretion system membrane protein [Bacteroidota bacterium]
MKKALLILSLLGIIFLTKVKGQDPGFSQYFNAPVFLNPANVGNFEGKIRLFGSYRQQWASITEPYTTTAAAVDFSMGRIGLGIDLLKDDPGAAALSHTQGLIGLSYRAFEGRHNLSLGLKTGFVQKSFDPTKFSFDSQYNPSTGFDPSNPSSEIFPLSRATMGDFHSGIVYNFVPMASNGFLGMELGASFIHFNEPQYSFIQGESFLPMRTNLYASFSFIGGERLKVSPMVRYSHQGPATQIAVGLNAVYEYSEEVSFDIGAHYRINDAFIPYVALKYQQFDIGLSYDVNISSLSNFSNFRGGPELTLGYIWDGKIKPPTPKTKYKTARVKSISDQDGDGIKDAVDRCPDIPGLRKFGGCPDSDGDGVIDSEDVCPTQPGPMERNGCPAYDRDGDGVLDKADKCPETPGLIAFMGCPDSDSDGLPDHIDKCPQEPGPRVRSGCPSSDIDADGDGIPNKVDMCPTIAGPADFQGCPDTDKDGVADFEDLCPKIPGLKTERGCPMAQMDSDKDGIPDNQDACPTVFGLLQFKGCPDTDKDGITDFEDKCPLTPGLVQNQGCPDGNMDVDGDGVPNMQDRCPYVPGIVSFQGCPDTDKDGLSDLDDACPLNPGPIANKGCPGAQTQKMQMSSDYLKEAIVYFDTDQAIIKPEFFQVLNEFADYLLQHPDKRALIAGHTDDRAKSQYNMVLGQNRAKAVQFYLRVRGVKEHQMDIISYGEIMPATKNMSENSRAMNRRANLIILR